MIYNALIKFFTISLSLITWSAVSLESVSKDKTFPPYPDVWGYDLSNHQALQTNEGLTIGYKMSNGDYWFKFRSILKINNKKPYNFTKDRYNLIKFFEGTDKQLNNAENEQLIKMIPRESWISRYNPGKITFSNGDTLEFANTTPHAKYCYIDDIAGSHFIKRDKNGKELGRYSILVAMPNINIVQDINESHEECSVSSEDGLIHKQLYSLSGALVKLEDDTFLIYDDYNIIARFDQNLKTKFNPIVNYKTRAGRMLSHNLFVLPFEIIDEMHEKLYTDEKPVSQGLQDGIMDYIIKNYND